MSIIDDALSALEAAGVETDGWRITQSILTDNPDTVIVLVETGGAPDLSDGTKYDEAYFQATVRGPGSEAARAKAQEVFAALNDGAVDNTVYVFAEGQILDLAEDRRGRHVYSVNFRALRERVIVVVTFRILQETGDAILQENGDYILLESAA